MKIVSVYFYGNKNYGNNYHFGEKVGHNGIINNI